MKKLTAKQEMFVNEYIIDLNATQAAIRAGYSPKTAAEQGVRLLRNIKVQEAIQAAMAERAERTDLKADTVVDELKTVAFVPLHEISERGGSWAVKVRALELLMKHLGLFEKDNSQQDKGMTINVEFVDGTGNAVADLMG
ncbi:terminase small subunit [Desulfatiferula olefinivorans]